MGLKRILCVEDDTDIQAVTRLALEAVGGFEVTLCSSGEEALGSASTLAPDLILMDVMMPGMDGPTTLQHLRADPATANIPVVFLTARAQPSEINHFRSLGALDVIAKPYNPLTLAGYLKDIWSQHFQ